MLKVISSILIQRILYLSIFFQIIWGLNNISSAQGIYNNGAKIVLSTATSSIYINGATGNYRSEGTGIFTNLGVGGVCNIRLAGNWVSNGTTSGFSNTTGSIVTFLGTAQTIGGTGTTTAFYDVNFQGGNNKTFTAGQTGASISNNAIVAAGTTVTANAKLTLISTATSNANLYGQTGGGYMFGDVIVQSWFSGGAGYRRFKGVSSPINDGSANLLNKKTYEQLKAFMVVTGNAGVGGGFDAGNTSSTIQTYLEPAAPGYTPFRDIPLITTANTPGTGFFVFYRGNRSGSKTTMPYPVPESQAIAYQGTVNQGPVTLNSSVLKYTPQTPNYFDGLNVVGNPYPATIDWSVIYATNSTDLRDIMYMLRPNSSGFQGWVNGAAFNTATATARLIQPGQAFYIQTIFNPSAQSISFSESVKYSGVLSPLRLLTAPESAGNSLNIGLGNNKQNSFGISSVSSPYKLIRFNVKDSENTEESLITFTKESKTSYEGLDAVYLGGSTLTLNTLSEEGANLLYNAYPTLDKLTEIKVNVNSQTSQKVSMNFTDLEAVGSYQIFLKDSLLHQLIDVKANPSYEFDIDRANPLSYGANRFSLVFKAPIMVKIVSFDAKKNKLGSELTWNTVNQQNTTRFELERSADGVTFVKIKDIVKKPMADNAGDYSYLDNSPVNGVNYYRLKQIDTSGQNTVVSDVVMVTFSDSDKLGDKGYLTIYPNPAVSDVNVRLANKSNVELTLTIFDLLGKKIKTANVNPDAVKISVAGLSTGYYVIEIKERLSNKVLGRAKFLKGE